MFSEHSKKSSGNRLRSDESAPFGEVLRQNDLTASVTRQLDTEQTQEIFGMISKGFIDHNQSSLLQQDMTLDEFESEARDPTVRKYLAESTNTKELQGYLSVHTQLEDIVWADLALLKRQQQMIGPGEESFYVGTFVVPKELRGLKIGGLLLEAALSQYVDFNQLNGNRSLCFFDRSDSGSGAMKEFVGRKLKVVEHNNPGFSISEIDTLYYVGLSKDLLPPKPGPEQSAKYGHRIINSEVNGKRISVVTGECLEKSGTLKASAHLLIKDRLPDLLNSPEGVIVLETRNQKAAFSHDIYDKQHFYQITPPTAQPL